MGADLQFLLYVRPRAEAQGAFARAALASVAALGPAYGGAYRDPSAPAPDDVFFSDDKDRGAWAADHERALAGAEARGEGEIMYRTTLADGEACLFWAGARGERCDGEAFWRVSLFCGLNQLLHDENLPAFLDALVLPLCASLRPWFGWGDVMDWYEDPTPQEVRVGAPRRLPWFALLPRPVVERIGEERLRAVGAARVVPLPGGDAILSTAYPSGFEEEVRVRERLSRDLGLPELFQGSSEG